MKNKKLHSFVSVMVLCFYFIALTPFHALYHYVEYLFSDDFQEANYNTVGSHSSSDKGLPTCEYCQFINFEGANVFLVSSIIELSFSPILFLHQIVYYQAPLCISFSGASISLRAPPAF